MKKTLIKLFLFTCFITAFSISNAQFWTPPLANTFPTTNPPNAGGFGTAGPLLTTMFRVNNGSVLFDGNNGPTPVFGGGSRLMWIPELSAFRAGGVNLTQWDVIGNYSFAGGRDTRAEGNYSTAFGSTTSALGNLSFSANFANTASGEGATAFGYGTQATADYTFSTGRYTKATGLYSSVFGYQSEANGHYSFAAGYNTIASGGHSVGLGHFNSATNDFTTAIGSNCNATGLFSMALGNFANATAQNSMTIGGSNSSAPITNSNPNSLWMGFECDSPTLYVGPGQGSGTYGNVGIGTSSPQAPLHVFAHLSDAAIFIPDGAPGTNPLVRISDPFGSPGMSMIRNGNRGDIRFNGTNLEMVAGGGTGGTGSTFILTPNVIDRVTVQGNVIPGNGCTFDLGTSAMPWNDIFLCNNPTIVSDVRLKENINDLEYGLDEIMKLRPVAYNLIGKDISDRQLGLIAQETEEVITEAVATGIDKNQTMGVKYSALIPVLIKGMQEQNTLIKELEEKVKTLEAINSEKSSENPKTIAPGATDGAYLKQNTPNPSKQNTVIKFYLPATIAMASLNIYDMTGKEIKAIPVNTRGEETGITINAGELIPGMYMYTLLADGKEIDTKKMIISQ